MGNIVSYILIGVLIAAMIVLMLVQGRRSKKAQDDYLAMLDTLRAGVKVKMASGLLGRIKEIREEAPNFKTVVITTGDDKNAVEMTFMIEAVQGIVNGEAINKLNAEKLAAAVEAHEDATHPVEEKIDITAEVKAASAKSTSAAKSTKKPTRTTKKSK